MDSSQAPLAPTDLPHSQHVNARRRALLPPPGPPLEPVNTMDRAEDVPNPRAPTPTLEGRGRRPQKACTHLHMENMSEVDF